MLLSSIDRALDEFVQAEEPRVLALTGEWGRGKTFYWRHFLASRPSEQHRARSYVYVSLFGLKDLRAIHDALVAGAVPIADLSRRNQVPEKSRSLFSRVKDHLTRASTTAERKAREFSDLVDKMPKLGALGPLARAVAFRLVDNYLVCIDDVERRSESLSLRDVLGIASLLREQRSCRVLIILNSDALSEADRLLFHSLREKVFDAEIVFEPSPAECAAIAFPGGSKLYERAAQYAIKLKITNIRVLYRIRRLIDAVSSQAMAGDDEVQTQIIQSSVLLGWSFNSRDGRTPLFSYVKDLNLGSFMDLDKTKQRPALETSWNDLLSDYGYTNTDDLDAAICEVLERGYVDTERLAAVLSNRSEAVRRARLERAFEDAWGLYHGSFDPAPDQLVSTFESVVRAGAEVISSVNMSATTLLLRTLGYEEVADDLTKHWIDVQSKTRPAILNIQASDWRDEIRDLHFRAEAQAAFALLPHTGRSFKDTAIALSQQNGWNEADIEVLGGATVDEYFALFKALSHPQTGYVVRTLMRFGQFDKSNADYGGIAERARAALVRIGHESALNRRRVKSYGVDLDTQEQPEHLDRDPPSDPSDSHIHAAG
jgi:hypothetical protein